MMEANIHWLDYAIVIATVILTIGVGLYFARRQKTADHYFSAGRNIPSWAIGMSIFATLISSVTFLAYPGAAFSGNWILLVQGLMVPVVLVAMIWVIVPLFRKVIKISTYEYFEKRFGFLARVYGSLAFALGHFSKMGTVFFLVSLAMGSFLGIDISTIIIVLGIAIIILTLLGGMEGVIWMDVIQGFLLIGGGIICVSILLFTPEGGPAEVFRVAAEYDKISFAPYKWDLTQLTFLVMALNGVFYAIQKYGTDQTIVQRYLAAKTDKDAKKAAYMGVFLSVPVWALFMLIGTGLFVYYKLQTGGAVLPEGVDGDAVFPYFIATQLPLGVRGLIIAGLAAAAISSLDSDMNALAAVTVQDYYLRFKPEATDKQQLKLGRIVVVLTGLASVGIALLYAYWGGEGVLGIVFGLYAIFSAGIVGLFLLGLLTRRANKQGLTVGIIVTILFTAYAMLTSSMFEIDGEKRLLLDMGACNFTHHKYMLGVYSHIIMFVVGYFASFLFKGVPLADKDLTIYGYWEQRKAVK